MEDKIQQARRKLFEDKYVQYRQYLKRNNDGSYNEEWVDARWQGFSAALDCVVIELPADCKLSRDGLDECFLAGQMRDDILHAIESTNLGIKVK